MPQMPTRPFVSVDPGRLRVNVLRMVGPPSDGLLQGLGTHQTELFDAYGTNKTKITFGGSLSSQSDFIGCIERQKEKKHYMLHCPSAYAS